MIALVLLPSLLGCATNVAQRRETTGYEPIDEMLGLLDQFDVAIEEKDFSGAERALEKVDERIKRAGLGTITHPRYTQVRGDLARGQARVKTARWQASASQRLASILAPTIVSESESKKPELARRLERRKVAADAYTQCIQASAGLERMDGHDPEILIPSALGELTLAGIQSACATKSRTAEKDVVSLGWQYRVQTTVDRVNERMKAFKAAEDPEDKREATDAALAALQDCQTTLEGTEETPGYDRRRKFAAHWASLRALDLRTACQNDHARLTVVRATLPWRVALSEVKDRIERAKEIFDAAMAEKDPEERIEPLAEAVETFEWCITRVEALKGFTDDAWQNARPSKIEMRVLGRILKRCRGDVKGVGRLLDRARKRAGG